MAGVGNGKGIASPPRLSEIQNAPQKSSCECVVTTAAQETSLTSSSSSASTEGSSSSSSLQLRLLSSGRKHMLNVGDSVQLDCRFHAANYNLFDYPVLWRKHQLDEEVQVNVMGNINEPFLSDRRFAVTFTASPSSSDTQSTSAQAGRSSQPRVYSLQLSITG